MPLPPWKMPPIAAQIEIEPDTGVIVLYVKEDKLGDHNRVYFSAHAAGGDGAVVVPG